MKYPNLRYGNPQAMNHYAQGIPLDQLAHKLRRSECAVSVQITQCPTGESTSITVRIISTA